MSRGFDVGDCVRVPDGRVGRVRAVEAGRDRVRVRRWEAASAVMRTDERQREGDAIHGKTAGRDAS